MDAINVVRRPARWVVRGVVANTKDNMNCPLPVSRVAHEVDAIYRAHEKDDFQSEYGMSMDEWLYNNNKFAEKQTEIWWKGLDAKTQRMWIITYRSEVETEIRDLQLLLTQLNDLL